MQNILKSLDLAVLRGQTFFPNTPLKVGDKVVRDRDKPYFPTGGTYVKLRSVAGESYLKGDVRVREFGSSRICYANVRLPKKEFSLSNPTSWLRGILGKEDPFISPEAICVNVPLRLSESGDYLYCTLDMFEEYRYSGVSAASIVNFTTTSGGESYSKKGGEIVAVKSRQKKFTMAYCGRDIVLPTLLPKVPEFAGISYKNGKEGVYSIMTKLTTSIFEYNQQTLLPKLGKWNFRAVLLVLVEYFSAVDGKHVPSTITNYDPATDSYEDDVIHSIYTVVCERSYTPKLLVQDEFYVE